MLKKLAIIMIYKPEIILIGTLKPIFWPGMKNYNWTLLVIVSRQQLLTIYEVIFCQKKSLTFQIFFCSPRLIGLLHLLKFFLAFVNVRYLPLTYKLKGAILTNYPNTIFLPPSVFPLQRRACYVSSQRPMNLTRTWARHFTITF